MVRSLQDALSRVVVVILVLVLVALHLLMVAAEAAAGNQHQQRQVDSLHRRHHRRRRLSRTHTFFALCFMISFLRTVGRWGRTEHKDRTTTAKALTREARLQLRRQRKNTRPPACTDTGTHARTPTTPTNTPKRHCLFRFSARWPNTGPQILWRPMCLEKFLRCCCVKRGFRVEKLRFLALYRHQQNTLLTCSFHKHTRVQGLLVLLHCTLTYWFAHHCALVTFCTTAGTSRRRGRRPGVR
uniref:Putative secreted peptide n=1 Tax=Anopheles braziliensis TaxID=58242 RepID=A0A2M3ZN20_9DIPT